MRLAVLAAALFISSCVGPTRLMKWKPDEGVAVVSIPLQPGSGLPSPLQVKEATRIVADRCGGRIFRLIEEGTDVSSSPYFSMFGGAAAAGTTTTASYYWIAKCEDAP